LEENHAPRPLPTDRLGFYIASGDQDILGQVSKLMNRSGYVGVMDTAGRIQYIIDGRRGSPYAARRIIETTGRILHDRQDTSLNLSPFFGSAADQVLAAHAIRQALKGFHFLRYLLADAGLDETRLRPISKTLYPAVARRFRVSASQVERDIRYCLLRSDFKGQKLTTVAIISRLYDELIQKAAEIRNKSAAPTEAQPALVYPGMAISMETPSGIGQ
jgi:hypothetical protein